MRRRDLIRTGPLAGLAVLGVLVGHWLGYLAAIPNGGQRVRVLAASGHGYWPSAMRVAVVAASIGAVAYVLRRIRVHRRSPDLEPSTLAIAGRLAVLQVVGFAGMEVAERLLAGAPLTTLLSHDVLVFGLVAQLVVAAAIAIALAGLGRAAVAMVRALRTRTVAVRPCVVPLVGSITAPRPRLLAGARGLRGPPFVLR